MSKIFPFPYMGGKGHLRREILPQIIDKQFEFFCEPFAGSAEISLQLMKYYKEKNIKKNFILNDVQQYIISFHNSIKNFPQLLIEKIKRIDKTEFNSLRDSCSYSLFDIFTLWTNSRFYYLNFTKKNKFSNQWNAVYDYKPNKIMLMNELYNFHNVKFYNLDYRELLEKIPENSFVYFDPPYTNTKVKYGSKFDLNEFKECIRNLKCPWLLSYNEEIGLGEVIMNKTKTNQYSANNKKGSIKTNRVELLIKSL
jgi:site-specific DNA-adenine methylase